MKQIDLSVLDPGIRDVVQWLRSEHFETTDSGDGVTKAQLIAEGFALDFPHVVVCTEPSALHGMADKLAWLLERKGVKCKPGMIQASYDPIDRSGIIMLSGVNNEMLTKGKR